MDYDVVIVGGGPGGSTLGTLLKKYDPTLSVAIFEREKFPREHVGESQLPPISQILDEMGCWDKVEAANFPIKIGATYRWGRDPELWDFEFLPVNDFHDEPRPAQYTGQRKQTAFQVERSLYDQILLDHAEGMGCEVHQQTGVTQVLKEQDRITGLKLSNKQKVTGRYYIDASGGAGVLRRAMGVEVDEPSALKNIAIWDYWENTEWAIEIGVGGTRVQVMSIGHGWLWFIPLSPTRTSIGFICPAAHYKEVKKSPEQLYLDAIAEEPRISALTRNATRHGTIQTIKDWSFIAQKLAGDNWFLVGESAGFADPILAAGMTLTQVGARELAHTIVELERGEFDKKWLIDSYTQNQVKRIHQHIRFADFWYSANGQFTDLQEYTAKIAKDAGLKLTPQKAFQWLGTGGFTNDVINQAGIGSLDLAAVKQITQLFTEGNLSWELNKFNRFKINLKGVKEDFLPLYREGRISREPCLKRGDKVIAISGMYKLLMEILKSKVTIEDIYIDLTHYFQHHQPAVNTKIALYHALQAMEVLLIEGWIKGTLDPRKSRLKLSTPEEGVIIHKNRDHEII